MDNSRIKDYRAYKTKKQLDVTDVIRIATHKMLQISNTKHFREKVRIIAKEQSMGAVYKDKANRNHWYFDLGEAKIIAHKLVESFLVKQKNNLQTKPMFTLPEVAPPTDKEFNPFTVILLENSTIL